MPGHPGVQLVFFTLEGFNGGNNYTFYVAAFQRAPSLDKTSRNERHRLIGFHEIGGGGWRHVNFDHFETSGDCAILNTLEYAAQDAMSHPTMPGFATYCLKHFGGSSNWSLEPEPPTRPRDQKSGR